MPDSITDSRELALTIDLCLRIGEVLLSSGAGAADVTVTMQSVAHHLGLRNAETNVTFTELSMSYQPTPEDPPLMLVRNVRQRGIDYEALTAVDQLVSDVLDDQLDVYLARTQMATLVSTGRSSPRWAVTLGFGALATSVAVTLGGGWWVAAIALLAAMAIDRIQLWLARRRVPIFYGQVAGGAVATLAAVGFAATPMPLNVSVVVTANIIILLAGIGFMGAIQDALTGFYITSGARIIEALLATAGIIAGVSGGLSVGSTLGVEVGQLEPGMTGLEDVTLFVLGSAGAAAAFAYTTYAPRRVLIPIAAITLVTASLYRAVELGGFGRTWAAASAAFLVGLVGYAVSGRVRVPPLVVVVPAIVPFLPGLSIYRGLSLLAEGGSATSEGLLSMMTAASVAVALASGVIAGEYVAQPLKREARKLEQRLAGPRLVGPFRATAKR